METKQTKSSVARVIFLEMHGQPNVARKDIIARFMTEASMSYASASSAYQTCLHPKEVVPRGEIKADKARAIFAETYGQPGVARKDIIARFVAEAELSHSGAATYYQQMKTKAAVAAV
jgi:hypothetical protein